MLNYFNFYARFLYAFIAADPTSSPALLYHITVHFMFIFLCFIRCICPMFAYAPSIILSLSHLLLILFLRFTFHFPHTIHPCDAIRLLRLTGDSEYLSRGEMMSTRSRQPRKSTNTAFPRLTQVPTTHRRIAPTPFHVSRPFSPVLLYFTTFIHFYTPPRISTVVTLSARSPVRRCATICHVVIFRRPYTFPHRLCCV